MKFNINSALGQTLLWIGFLGGSFAAVSKLENTESPWQTIPWTLYVPAAFVGIAGIVLLRREKQNQQNESASSEAGLESVIEFLTACASKVSDLEVQLETMTCEDVLEYIDQECIPHFADFADGRMVIANRFGTQAYADVMTEFASGERYLNRAWSAAADGYVDEVETSVKYSNTFMKAAIEKLSSQSPD